MAKKQREVSTVALANAWIQDLMNIGMSRSRISARLKLSPSTIQKIAAQKRCPRNKTILALGDYYLKIFESPEKYGSKVKHYFLSNKLGIEQAVQQAKQLMQQLDGSCQYP